MFAQISITSVDLYQLLLTYPRLGEAFIQR